MTSSRFVPLSVAAEYVSMSEAGMRKFIAEGRITGYRLGRRAIRVDMREVEGLLQPIPTAKQAGS